MPLSAKDAFLAKLARALHQLKINNPQIPLPENLDSNTVYLDYGSVPEQQIIQVTANLLIGYSKLARDTFDKTSTSEKEKDATEADLLTEFVTISKTIETNLTKLRELLSQAPKNFSTGLRAEYYWAAWVLWELLDAIKIEASTLATPANKFLGYFATTKEIINNFIFGTAENQEQQLLQLFDLVRLNHIVLDLPNSTDTALTTAEKVKSVSAEFTTALTKFDSELTKRQELLRLNYVTRTMINTIYYSDDFSHAVENLVTITERYKTAIRKSTELEAKCKADQPIIEAAKMRLIADLQRNLESAIESIARNLIGCLQKLSSASMRAENSERTSAIKNFITEADVFYTSSIDFITSFENHIHDLFKAQHKVPAEFIKLLLQQFNILLTQLKQKLQNPQKIKISSLTFTFSTDADHVRLFSNIPPITPLRFDSEAYQELLKTQTMLNEKKNQIEPNYRTAHSNQKSLDAIKKYLEDKKGPVAISELRVVVDNAKTPSKFILTFEKLLEWLQIPIDNTIDAEILRTTIENNSATHYTTQLNSTNAFLEEISKKIKQQGPAQRNKILTDQLQKQNQEEDDRKKLETQQKLVTYLEQANIWCNSVPNSPAWMTGAVRVMDVTSELKPRAPDINAPTATSSPLSGTSAANSPKAPATMAPKAAAFKPEDQSVAAILTASEKPVVLSMNAQ